MPEKVKFKSTSKSQFFATVRARVDEYFEKNSLSKNANGLMVAKTIFFLGAFVGLYALIVSGAFSLWAMLVMAILLGMVTACIGFNVCHDAIHGSYSSNPKVNKALGFLFNIIGANAYVWSITHNIIHHTYTNIHGHDEDLEIAPGLIRLSVHEKPKKIQRYQHIYGLFLYGLASLSWVFRKDFIKFFKKELGSYDNSNPPKQEYFNLFFFKGLYYVLFIVVPLIVLDLAWWQFLIGFLAMHLAEGWVLGLVFQLAHVVEDTEFPEPDENNIIEEAWAAHQMKTTANFSTGKFLATWFCGGLNMQVEHHLFPKICHIHYPQIAPIVKKTAHEFGLPYIENKTFVSAIGSHYRILKKYAEDAKNLSSGAKQPTVA
ncbi:acyl-CoA desaturase [Cytophagaceae bacterium ABcell3]|nr:acyl-CoA desaturase [Cytophagaceae bacterium ABcell3]